MTRRRTKRGLRYVVIVVVCIVTLFPDLLDVPVGGAAIPVRADVAPITVLQRI